MSLPLETVIMRADPLVTLIKSRVAAGVKELKEREGITPKLVALLIGKDPVSRTYVKLKQADCAEVGIISDVIDLSAIDPEGIAASVLDTVEKLSSDRSVHAILPQMPFNGAVSEQDLFGALDPDKDVDGLTPLRLGKLLRKEYDLESSLLPCTPKGIALLLRHYGVQLDGSDVAIIGRSILVSEPLRKLLQDMNATATCYHTHSRNISEKIMQADIVVAASGRPPEIFGSSGFRLTSEMVKQGSTVVSVGVRKDPNTAKMLYDVDTASLKGHCSFLTPNTGGVGAMTRAALLQNTLTAARLQSR
jgi:methylenetetrahydrofolate dehydrogenase (NADP+)/methenyltetrahydrofolate cyclohydrolase